jgi:hypothetical protein
LTRTCAACSGIWSSGTTPALDALDVVRVGDDAVLPLGTLDPVILRWGEENGRILVSFDKSTLPRHLAEHLAAGHHCPGIFMVSGSSRPPDILEFRVLAAHASDAAEWQDTIRYVP